MQIYGLAFASIIAVAIEAFGLLIYIFKIINWENEAKAAQKRTEAEQTHLIQVAVEEETETEQTQPTVATKQKIRWIAQKGTFLVLSLVVLLVGILVRSTLPLHIENTLIANSTTFTPVYANFTFNEISVTPAG